MNATEVVAAVRRATVIVTTRWEPGEFTRVAGHMPPPCFDRKVSLEDWAITVELLRREYETPGQAAERLARYMILHEERWGETPSVAGFRRTLLEGERDARDPFPDLPQQRRQG